MKPLNVLVTLLVILVLGSSGVPAAENGGGGAPSHLWADAGKSDEKEKPDEIAIQLKITDATAPSLVRVEYTLRYDKGEPPSGSGFRIRCPNCGSWHGFDESETVKEERPLESPGFVLTPTRVITPDVMIHPRFVKSIAVRYGDEVVSAKVSGWGKDQNATFLDLDKPLTGAKALNFTPDAEGPYYAVVHARRNGVWTTGVKALSKAISTREDGRRFISAPSYCLIVNDDAVPVGMSMTGELRVDDSWKGAPLEWEILSAKEMGELLEGVTATSRGGVLRVALSFRSPKKSGRGFSRYSDDEDEGKTERNVPGLLIDEKRVLVLVNLKPKVTGRLARVVVHTQDGEKVKAAFDCTLTDYGCFLASLDKPLPGKLTLSSEKITDFLNRVLLAADIRLQGETRSDYFNHRRIVGYEIGWRRNLYPEIPDGGEGKSFLFDSEGRLVAFPVSRRQKASVEERWSYDGAVLTASGDFKQLLSDLTARDASKPGAEKQWSRHIDPSNVPLTEEQENRLAWVGMELQPLNKELARANNVSKLSGDGKIGALVSYVYQGSPAEKAGVEIGYILLRLHVEGHPKPLEVQIEPYGFLGRAFPWEQYDQLTEQYFDRMPRPWPPAENTVSRALTDLGFGKKFRAEFFSDGNVIYKDSEVVQSPPHYDSARKHKSEPLGLTVRDLTYEVRRYFHKKDDDPGVIVSKIEPGSKASVSGIKPYEIITHVNRAPVMSADDFSKLIVDREELRLSVKRMTKGRVVLIKLKGHPKSAATKPATDPLPRKAATTREGAPGARP